MDPVGVFFAVAVVVVGVYAIYLASLVEYWVGQAQEYHERWLVAEERLKVRETGYDDRIVRLRSPGANTGRAPAFYDCDRCGKAYGNVCDSDNRCGLCPECADATDDS